MDFKNKILNENVLYENYFLKLILKDALINHHIYTIKCAMACVLSIALASFLVPQDLLSASFIAFLCVKPTFYSGIVLGKEQFFASFIGGAITGGLLILFGQSLAVTALALIIVMLLCLYKRWNNYLTVAIFTVLYMVLIPQDTTIHTVAVRISSVILGVMVASLINLIFSLVSYKSFFYFRVKFASSLVFERLKKTIEGNKTANVELLDNLYFDYQEINSELNEFCNELVDIEKELKLRKKAGGIEVKDAFFIYRIIESLKMSSHYLHDITYLSKVLAPNHYEIPREWKDKLDLYSELANKKFEQTLRKLFLEDTSEAEIKETLDINFIYEISESIKTSSEKQKMIFADVMAIAIDFQQLLLTLTNFDYFSTEYIRVSFKNINQDKNNTINS